MTHESAIDYESKSSKRNGPKEIFGVVVRTAGLIVAIYGLDMLFYATIMLVSGSFFVMDAIIGVASLALGIALIKGNWLANFAYGRN